MSLPKKILEDFLFRIRHIFYFVYNNQINEILLYPEFPSKRTIIWKMMKNLKYNITNNIHRSYAEIAISWENVTSKTIPPELEFNKNLNSVLNINCLDISKINVDKIFSEVFGYGTLVDPLRFQGFCVRKSNVNAKHDGQLIQCPISKEDYQNEFVYQIIINNKKDSSYVEDIRVPVIGKDIPFVYLKYRPVNERFSNTNAITYMKEAKDFLTQEELSKIFSFSEKIGLDYGELDVLRNRDDKKIYIVDVNFTPWGPPNHLSKKDRNKAQKILAQTFHKQFMC